MTKNGQFVQSKKYVCYHILPKDGKPGKVGATEFLDQRVIVQQVGKGAKYGTDWVVLREDDNLTTISKTERHFQTLFGYPLDPSTFEEIKTMNKTSTRTNNQYTQNKSEPISFYLSNNKSWYSVYYTNDKLELYKDITANGILVDGTVYNDKETIALFTGPALQSSKWKGFFIASRVVDDYFSNLEMIGAHKLWAGNTIQPEGSIDRDAMWEEATLSSVVKDDSSGELVAQTTKVTIDQVFDLQKSLQQEFTETKNIGNQTIAATAKAAQRNLHAFMDEVMEYMNALGGEEDGIGKAGWKYWKQDYAKAKTKKVKRLSAKDLELLKYEYVDMFHFFINWGLMIGIGGQELLDMYAIKNAENFDRQRRGY